MAMDRDSHLLAPEDIRARLEMDEIALVSVPACRVCGCTDALACVGGCIWAEPNLCSRCVG